MTPAPRPDTVKITVPEFRRVAEQYAKEHPVGGSLHIVTDDGNLEDDNVRFCLEYALKDGDYYGACLALLLLHMTKTQRGKVSREWYRWAGW